MPLDIVHAPDRDRRAGRREHAPCVTDRSGGDDIDRGHTGTAMRFTVRFDIHRHEVQGRGGRNSPGREPEGTVRAGRPDGESAASAQGASGTLSP